MATNLVFRNIDSKNRWDDIGRTVQSGDPVISTWGPAVAVTASGDATSSEVIASSYDGTGTPFTLSGIPVGGVGNEGTEYAAAIDGTWEFLATDFEGTAPDPATITKGTEINYDEAENKLTTAAVGSGVVPFGKVDFPKDYDKTRGYVPVRIGVEA